MKEINCSNLKSTIDSAANVLNISSCKLKSQLKKDDWQNLLTEPLPTPESVIWFHATRISRSTDYREGLLPTSQIKKKLHEILHQLAINEKICSESKWNSLVNDLSSTEISWKNSLLKSDDGPHGFLVRDVIIDNVIIDNDKLSIMDYTDMPEYVRIFCNGFPKNIRKKLLSAYKNNTNRAIVSFRSKHLIKKIKILKYALTYAHIKILKKKLDEKCNCGFSREGKKIEKKIYLILNILRRMWIMQIFFCKIAKSNSFFSLFSLNPQNL